MEMGKLPSFGDMDPDGCIEVVYGDEDVQDTVVEHCKYVYVGHYLSSQELRGRPWRRTKDWIPRVPPSGEYTESDFAWALSRILGNVVSTYDLYNRCLGLSTKECGQILLMREQAEQKAKPPVSFNSAG